MSFHVCQEPKFCQVIVDVTFQGSHLKLEDGDDETMPPERDILAEAVNVLKDSLTDDFELQDPNTVNTNNSANAQYSHLSSGSGMIDTSRLESFATLAVQTIEKNKEDFQVDIKLFSFGI